MRVSKERVGGRRLPVVDKYGIAWGKVREEIVSNWVEGFWQWVEVHRKDVFERIKKAEKSLDASWSLARRTGKDGDFYERLSNYLKEYKYGLAVTNTTEAGRIAENHDGRRGPWESHV